MQYKDYYKILDVAQTATVEEIKKAYRKLVRKYHPDLNHDSDATSKTAEINEAYAVLSDAEKRQAYDELSKQSETQEGQAFHPPPGWTDNFNFTGDTTGTMDNEHYSDFFEQLFRHSTQSRSENQYHSESRSMRGKDQYAHIELSIEESYHGTEQILIFSNTGYDAQGHPVNKKQKNKVKIPKGVYEGQHIRLAGKGHPGMGGAPAGDLLLEVQFKPDKRWRAQGSDVFQPLRLTPWEAALGKAIKITTPGGKKKVTIPPNAKTGSKLRLKQQGIPAKTPGHLYLILEVVLPSVTTDDERQAFEHLESLYPNFNPRHDIGA